MTFFSRAGATAATSGTQTFPTGFQPKALVFSAVAAADNDTAVAAELSSCYGVSDGTTTLTVLCRDVDNQATTNTARGWGTGISLMDGAGTISVTGSIAFTATGFTITWDSAPGTLVVHWLALGGSDLQAKVLQFTKNGTGSGSFTGVGFQPTSAILLGSSVGADAPSTVDGDLMMSVGVVASADHCIGMASDDAQASSDANRQHWQTRCLFARTGSGAAAQFEADFTSFDADGFTLNWVSNVTANCRYGGLFLRGVTANATSFNADSTSGAHTQSVTGLPAQPDAGMLFSVALTAASAANNAHGIFSMGFWDTGLNQAGTSWFSKDAQADSVTEQGGSATSAVYGIGSSSAPFLTEVGAIANIGATSFDVVWSTKGTTSTSLWSLLQFTGSTTPDLSEPAVAAPVFLGSSLAGFGPG